MFNLQWEKQNLQKMNLTWLIVMSVKTANKNYLLGVLEMAKKSGWLYELVNS